MSEYELRMQELKDLATRLGVKNAKHGSQIKVTPLRTIIKTKYHDGTPIEYPFNSYIKEVIKKMEKGQDLIKYDQQSNRFYLVEKDDKNPYTETNIIYEIGIDPNDMSDYATGKYNDITLKFHGLYLRSEELSKIEEKERLKKEEAEKVIRKATNSNEKLTPKETGIYIDHLQKENRKETKDVAKKSAKLAAVTSVPLAGALITGAICFAPGAAFAYTALAGVLGATMGGLAEGTFNLIVNDSPTLEILPIQSVKTLLGEIREKRKSIKMNKTKAKELMKGDYVKPNTITIKENPLEELNLQDPVMDLINSMVDRLAYVSPQLKEPLLVELKSILNNYIERKKDIIDHNEGFERKDNLVSLRNDICKQLAKVELKMNDVKVKDEKTQAIDKEGNLLKDKIEKAKEFEPDNKDEINSMIAEANKYLNSDIPNNTVVK